MGATLATLRKYIRAEVGDPAPTRKLSSLTLTHDTTTQTTFFQDATHNFVTLGVIVGDVIYNTSDGGSLAVIHGIESGSGTNDKLMVSSIEGGTENDYDNGDVVQIYDRHAQTGLDGTRFTDSEVEDALAQAQKVVALRFGGVEQLSIHEDIEVQTKVNYDNLSGTFVVGETVTGGTGSGTGTVEYVASDFLVISNTWGAGVKWVDGETITGGTSSATADVNEPSGFSVNNITVGQGMPTDVKHVISVEWWNSSQWDPVIRDHIEEYNMLPRSTGDPRRAAVYGHDHRLWLWPNNSTEQTNAIRIRYMAWDNALSEDTDTTLFDNRVERLIILEAAKILAGGSNEDELWQRITTDIQIHVDAILSSADNEVSRVRQEIDWDSGYGDDGAFL